MIPSAERQAPIVTVLGGLALAELFGWCIVQQVIPLGVDRFSQSGARNDLYAYENIDAGSIVNATLIALEQP